ncbi:DUF4268 domain-containing protein [Candidatus Poribacteria bacterium]|nr:DUF4268 domain-containing protein [Candidatus Poribacteria bacterium]
MSIELSRLEPVELRDQWNNEASDFTPWLAIDENLELLGNTLGIELELEGQEINVGRFHADLLCKNTLDNTWVVIENQLEKTNHLHLGQIITYSAGLDAHTIIWIASEFQDEHRAALDKLNEITQEEYQFFGIEIKLWQIENSKPAPQFEIVSSPNKWDKNVRSTINKNLSETQYQHLEFWTQFTDYMEQNGNEIILPEPNSRHNFDIRIGTRDTVIRAWRYKKSDIGVTLDLGGTNGKNNYYILQNQEIDIQESFDSVLEWEERPKNVNSRITLRKNGTDPTDETDWGNQNEWLAANVELFYKVFKPRIDGIKNS